MSACIGKTKKGDCTNKAMYVVGNEVVCFIHLQTSLKEQLGTDTGIAAKQVVVRLAREDD
jgi:hypothetical protein